LKPLVTIFTPTYNKPAFFREAARSILDQTVDDWLWWVVLDGADEETTGIATQLAYDDPRIVVFTEKVENRYEQYRPAVLVNKYFPMITTKYLCWHSDDDLKEPCFLEVLVGELEGSPSYHVAYGLTDVYLQQGKKWSWLGVIPPDKSVRFGPGSADSPDGKLDSGQFLQTKASWDQLNYTVPTGYGSAIHSDGVYLEHLARNFEFRFVDVVVQRCRATHLSENRRGSALDPIMFQNIRLATTNGHHGGVVLGSIDRVVDFRSELMVLGWLAAASPRIKRVLVADSQGKVAPVPFQVKVVDRPDAVAATVGRLPEGSSVAGFYLMVESPGAAPRIDLQLELDGGASCSATLSRDTFELGTETFRRDMIESFRSEFQDTGMPVDVCGPPDQTASDT
jgi:Glycosyl transferase family 2